jgi:hypothetical protein
MEAAFLNFEHLLQPSQPCMLPAEPVSGLTQILNAAVPALQQYIVLVPYSTIVGHVALAWSASSHFLGNRTL